MKKFIMIVATFAVVLLILISGFHVSTTSSKEIVNTQEVTFRIDGMTCKMCSVTITTALKKLDGVVDVEVSYKDKVARVSYEDVKIDVNEMVKAIENAGNYQANIINNGK